MNYIYFLTTLIDYQQCKLVKKKQINHLHCQTKRIGNTPMKTTQ